MGGSRYKEVSGRKKDGIAVGTVFSNKFVNLC